MLLINFKTYPQAVGPKALELAKGLAQVAKGFPKVEIGFAPPALELAEVAAHSGSPVWAQHVDPAGEGQYTGYLSPNDAKAAGAVGTFLNHSERPLDQETLKETLDLAKKAELKVLIFAKDPTTVAQVAALQPDWIAYEPPELIGGKISVTSAKPQIIQEALEKAGAVPLLVGAGVHSREDVQTALKLGAKGAVVSSAVVTAENPAEAYRQLLSGF